MIVAGIDIGSLTSKALIMEGDEILASYLVPTGSSSRQTIQRIRDAISNQIGLSLEDLDFTVATGYGRIKVDFADKQITEISCHAKGASYLFPQVRTVIDIGGQDSKVIRINSKGKAMDFAMNDKCAAGTGRFLEVMAKALEVRVEELGELSSRAKDSLVISSMCTVFAESEVVSLIAEGYPKEEIIKGLHNAVADRTMGLVHRVGLTKEVAMSGGVAKNRGVVAALEEKLGESLNISSEPQLVGALGAALLARDRVG